MSAPRPHTDDADPAAAGRRAGGRTVAGSRFVVLAVIALALFVTFIVVGSPVLLERTLERVPPPAPHTVQTGSGWEVTATQLDDDTACVEVAVDDATTEHCVGPRGAPLRLVDARSLDAGGAVAFGIVDPRTAEVALELADGGPLVLEVAYVDFGFPLGFYATKLRPGTAVERVVARDGEGEARADARCDGDPTADACEVRDLR